MKIQIIKKLVVITLILLPSTSHTMLKNISRARPAARAVEEAVSIARSMPKAQTLAVARASLAATAKEKAALAPKAARRTFSTGRTAQAVTPQASKAAGFAHEVTAWAKANPVKVIGSSVGVASAATGITAYLCKERINELTLEQFNKHTDEIYKKAKENKIVRTLVAHFIARNFININLDKIENFVKKNPDAAKIIAIGAAKNFSSLITTWSGRDALAAIANGSPDAAKILAPEAAKNFSSLITTKSGHDALRAITRGSPEAATILAQEATKNFSSLTTTVSGREALEAITKGSTDAATILTSEAIQHIDSLTQSEEKIEFLTTISKNADKEIKIKISQKLSTIIKKNLKKDPKNNLKIRFLYAELSGDDTYTKDLTPSKIFLGNNFTKTVDINDIEAIKAFEKEHKSGYVLAYHGQRFLYLPLSQLFTDLKAAHDGKDRPNDFLYPHIKDQATYGTAEQQSALLQKLRTHGRGKGDDTEIERQTLLFLQLVPFDGHDGTCPYIYFKSNRNAAEIKANVAHVFKSAGYENFYAKYGSELEDIFTKMEKCSKYGNLLCIAVPNDIAQDQIYPSYSGGPKTIVNVNGKKTDSAPLAYAAYKKGQFKVDGGGSWVMIMLGKAIDPESGIKVMPLYDIKKGKEQKYLELVFKYEEVWKRIRADIEHEMREKKVNPINIPERQILLNRMLLQ